MGACQSRKLTVYHCTRRISGTDPAIMLLWANSNFLCLFPSGLFTPSHQFWLTARSALGTGEQVPTVQRPSPVSKYWHILPKHFYSHDWQLLRGPRFEFNFLMVSQTLFRVFLATAGPLDPDYQITSPVPCYMWSPRT